MIIQWGSGHPISSKALPLPQAAWGADRLFLRPRGIAQSIRTPGQDRSNRILILLKRHAPELLECWPCSPHGGVRCLGCR